MSHLHFADNASINRDDKLYKIRPLIERLQANFKKHFIPEQNLGYDEAMIRYFGTNSMKQFIRGKPIRFGYKVWCLNTPKGYLVDFEVYQGKNPDSNETYDKSFGKATAPLMKFIDQLPDLPFSFFFDNLFCSVQLLLELERRGLGGTGTMRPNRIPKSAPLPDKKCFLKKDRGDVDWCSSAENNIGITIWKDNKPVVIGSNCNPCNPLQTCQRFSRESKQYVSVQVPNSIKIYNCNMGGTDRMDNNVSNYRTNVRGNKWYFPIVTWLLDVAVQNGWLLHKSTGGSLTLFQFRRAIAVAYLESYGTEPKGPGRFSNKENFTAGKL